MAEPLPNFARREVEISPEAIDLTLRPGEDENTPAGIVCPRCGCPDLRVGRTQNLDSSVRRYRYCRACGRGLPTVEVPGSMLADLQRRAGGAGGAG